MVRKLHLVLTLAATLLASGSAYADGPKGEGPGKATKEARDKVHEEKKELREAHKTGDAGAIKEAKEDLKEARKELSEAAKERRKAHMAELRAKWGTILKMDGVKEEMRTHSSRLARLRRIEKIAKEKGKDAVAKRAEANIEKEKARHDKKMAELKAKGADGGAAAAPAASGGAK